MQGSARDVVAVKCIERGKLTKISMENLLTEIEVMKELDHKHVVKLKDFEVFRVSN
jgi:serine/threonine-protein kinase ULK/ATG1